MSHTSQAYKLLSWIHAKLTIVPYSGAKLQRTLAPTRPRRVNFASPAKSKMRKTSCALEASLEAKLRLRKPEVCISVYTSVGKCTHTLFPLPPYPVVEMRGAHNTSQQIQQPPAGTDNLRLRENAFFLEKKYCQRGSKSGGLEVR